MEMMLEFQCLGRLSPPAAGVIRTFLLSSKICLVSRRVMVLKGFSRVCLARVATARETRINAKSRWIGFPPVVTMLQLDNLFFS
jgi:hypothetical protein